MKKIVIGITVSFAVVFGLVMFSDLGGSTETGQQRFLRRFPSGEDSFFWIDNYAEALAQAKFTGKPIFLEFRCVP